MAEASYTKLKDGSWGLRVKGSIKTGEVVTVRKKDGTTKQETVVRVLWNGDGITLCSIAQRQTAGKSSDGYAPGKRCYCSECGEHYRKGQHCWGNGGNCIPSWE